MVSNTLIITKLPKAAPEFLEVSKKFKELIPDPEEIVHWVDLKSLTRILVVFKTSEACVRAKTLLEGRISAGSWYTDTQLQRVPVLFYGVNTPLYNNESAQSSFLQLPDAGKLWFLSPPPSPPVGWEPRLEDEPNKDTHFDFDPMVLHEALENHKALVEGVGSYKDNDKDSGDADASVPTTATESTTSSSLSSLSTTTTTENNQKSPSSSQPKLSVDIACTTIHQGSGPNSQVTTPTIIVAWEPESGGGLHDPINPRAFPKTEMPLIP